MPSPSKVGFAEKIK